MSFNLEMTKNIIRLGTALIILLLILNFGQIEKKVAYLDEESVEIGQSSLRTGPGIGAVIPASCPSYEHTAGECTPPSADIKANGSDSQISVEYNRSAIISWSSANASECAISPTGWTGTSGSQSIGPLTSNLFTTINCSGPGGSASDSVSIVVFRPAPVIGPGPGGGTGGTGGTGGGEGGGGGGSGECSGFCATPSTIGPGGSSVLSWSSTNSTSCSINQGVGSVSTTGTVTVSPLTTTEYTLTCTGLGGTATAKTTVTVFPIPKFKEVKPD